MSIVCSIPSYLLTVPITATLCVNGAIYDNHKSIVAISGGPLTGTYKLDSFHAHWGAPGTNGSEHQLNGKDYAAEVGRLDFFNC